MRIIRDVREVARLWLCESFIPAFHFVFGWPHKAGSVYRAIRQSGRLLPAAEVGRGGLFVLDVLAGDDKYNFLAAVGKPMGTGGPICYGFIFDAERLIEQGALLGTEDLLLEYAAAAHAVTKAAGFGAYDADHVAVLGRQKFSPKAVLEFVNHGSEVGGWGRYETKLLRDYLPEMLRAFGEVQHEYRFSGAEALDKLHAWAEPVCTRMREALSLSIGYMRHPDFHEYYLSNRREWALQDGTAMGGWTRSTACKSAIRDVYYFQHHELLPFALRKPPEILWPGALPLHKAVAAFELPCREDGYLRGTLDWPDSLFSLLCPRDFGADD